MTVQARESGAPTADDLLGRPHVRILAGAITKTGATLRGIWEDPMHPARGRAKVLAEWDRGLDVDVSGGTRLRALDAADGRFHVHVMPPFGSKSCSLHVSLASEGDEKKAIIQDHPHSPRAPVGFYNLDRAQAALGVVRQILENTLASPDTSRVNRNRAENILARVEATQGWLDSLAEARTAQPKLGLLADAAALAYGTKKAGDASDVKLTAALAELDAYVAAGAGGLEPERLAQVREDIQTIRDDRDKWVGWHASTGVFTFYVNR